MSDESPRVHRAKCDCCAKVAACCVKTGLCAVCVRHANASFAIEVRKVAMAKARAELGKPKPPKGTA